MFNNETGAFEVANLADLASTDKVAIHDETDLVRALALSQLEQPDFPVPLGVIYADQAAEFVETRGFSGTKSKWDRDSLKALL